jgi:hypothetical protein
MAVLAAGPVVLVAVVALLDALGANPVLDPKMVVALPEIIELGSLAGGLVTTPPLPTVNLGPDSPILLSS